MSENEPETCEICAKPFASGETCAIDIELGTVHAECLDGSPVVNLDTGEPSDGPLLTFPYEALSALQAPSAPAEMGVGVKALEFDETGSAKSRGLSYDVWLSRDAANNYREVWIAALMAGGRERIGNFNSRAEAIAAAQADFERRIRSTLLPAPDAEKDEIARLTELVQTYRGNERNAWESRDLQQARALIAEGQVAALVKGLWEAATSIETAASRFNLMGGSGLVNGADPRVGYREAYSAGHAARALLARIQPALNGHSNDAGRS